MEAEAHDFWPLSGSICKIKLKEDLAIFPENKNITMLYIGGF